MWLEIVARRNLGTNAKPIMGVKLALGGKPYDVSDGTWLESPMGRWKSDMIEVAKDQKAVEEDANWLETELQKLDLDGRDDFYTHLITQEIPMWLSKIRAGGSVEDKEVYWLIKRRGFNEQEAEKFKHLAKWLNARAKEIRRRGA